MDQDATAESKTVRYRRNNPQQEGEWPPASDSDLHPQKTHKSKSSQIKELLFGAKGMYISVCYGVS